MTLTERMTAANKINDTFSGKIWCGELKKPEAARRDGAAIRIYAPMGNGYIEIAADGHANINAVKRGSFDAAKLACESAGVAHSRV